MTLSNAVKQRIVDLATGNQITIHKLALNSGVPYSTLSSFLSGMHEYNFDNSFTYM